MSQGPFRLSGICAGRMAAFTAVTIKMIARANIETRRLRVFICSVTCCGSICFGSSSHTSRLKCKGTSTRVVGSFEIRSSVRQFLKNVGTGSEFAAVRSVFDPFGANSVACPHILHSIWTEDYGDRPRNRSRSFHLPNAAAIPRSVPTFFKHFRRHEFQKALLPPLDFHIDDFMTIDCVCVYYAAHILNIRSNDDFTFGAESGTGWCVEIRATPKPPAKSIKPSRELPSRRQMDGCR
jgi:hypothetical protein